MRDRFNQQLGELRDDILKMGSMVEEELQLALSAFETMDLDLAQQVFEADKAVNAARYEIEEKCFTLIVTQQPAAGDLRSIVAVMNMIVDLERMGDQAKGIAKIIRRFQQHGSPAQPAELRLMGQTVGAMLHDSLTAYAQGNVDQARHVVERDDEVDRYYAQIFTKIMEKMAESESPNKVEANYEVLRTARELERFGDLATNIAERAIYLVTGSTHDLNNDQDDILDHYLDR